MHHVAGLKLPVEVDIFVSVEAILGAPASAIVAVMSAGQGSVPELTAGNSVAFWCLRHRHRVVGSEGHVAKAASRQDAVNDAALGRAR